ncbi:MAG: hypothetical protein AABY22_16540, partial [Nanoarchaeota archaeon]
GCPFILTIGSVSFNFDGGADETYDMSSYGANGDRQKLADNATTYWLDNITRTIHSNYPNLLLTASLFTPYSQGRSDYDGVQSSSQSQNVRIYSDEVNVSYINIHLYPTPVIETIYNITTDLDTARLNKTGSNTAEFSDGTNLNKPMMMGEFGALKQTGDPLNPVLIYPNISRAIDVLVSHQINSCEYGFTGWVTWTWNTTGDFWHAKEKSGAIKTILGQYTNPCDRNRFVFQNNTRNILWLDDKGNVVISFGNISKPASPDSTYCNSATSDSFIFRDSNNNNIAYVDTSNTGSSSGRHLCIERNEYTNCNTNPPSGDSFRIQNSSGTTVAAIDADGDLCYSGSKYDKES